MKKNSAFKVLAILGAILLILGLIVALIGVAMGGFGNWRNTLANYWNWGNRFNTSDHYNNGGNAGGGSYWHNLTNYNDTLSETITSLDLQLAAGTLTVEIADKGGYEITDYPAEALDISFVDGNLSIIDGNLNLSSYGNFRPASSPQIKIYITESVLDSFNLVLGAGTFQLENCSVGSFTQNMGAGDTVMHNVQADYYDVNNGAGNLHFSDCVFANVHVTNGAGDFEFDGIMTGNCYFENGAGLIKLDLKGDIDDYYFVCSQGVGRIQINNAVRGGLGGEFAIGNGSASNQIKITSGVGDVEVDIERS